MVYKLIGLGVAACASLFTHVVLAFELITPLQQGALVFGKALPGEQVFFDGRKLKLDQQGNFIVGLDRDEPGTIEFRVVSEDKEAIHKVSVAQREYRIQKIEGVPQETVTPNPDQVARSRKEAAMVWAARNHYSDLGYFQDEFSWPLTGPITGVYGSQRVYNGVPKRPHYGLDIARPTGTRVKAPVGGIVRLVHSDMFYSGGTLIVDHGHGLSSSFIHLSKILVSEGDEIQAGQEIAEVGSSGRATGPHLDWRMNWFGRKVDPGLLVGPMENEVAKE
ncbi:M23 family metallopeptidase [Sessilibacter sp. MAH1]